MEKNSKKVRWNVIKALKDFEEYIKGKKLDFPKKDEKFDKLSKKLMDFFHFTDLNDMAVFCALLGYDSEAESIYEYLGLSRIDSIRISPILQDFFKKGITVACSLTGTRVRQNIISSISKNMVPIYTPVSLVDYIISVFESCEDINDEYDSYQYLIEDDTLASYDMFKELFDMGLDFTEIFIIFQIFKEKHFRTYHYRTIQEFTEWSEGWIIEKSAKNGMKSFRGFLELEKKNGTIGDDTRIVFTTEAKDFFKKYNVDVILNTDKCENTDVIKCEDIRVKNLFYSKEVNKQIKMMKDVLSETKIKEVRQTLEDNGLHSGITILLYGKPGTGKTESVYQIAKATGRDILKVDMGTMKSCWFGESEQIVRRLFKSYRNLCKKSEITPILLLNEADAIIGKRKDTNSSNVAQTENAIQDIMLDEIENLDGILIATTNIVSNFDEAFERRFLFKTEFDNPTKEAREQIWKDKLPWLSDSDIELIAKDFGFSGGQIDNILRKSIMTEVITGKKPSIEELIEMCKVEKLDKDNTTCGRIGFCS